MCKQGHLSQSGHCAQLCSNQIHCGPISTFQAEGHGGCCCAQHLPALAPCSQVCKPSHLRGNKPKLKSSRTQVQQHHQVTSNAVDLGCDRNVSSERGSCWAPLILAKHGSFQSNSTSNKWKVKVPGASLLRAPGWSCDHGKNEIYRVDADGFFLPLVLKRKKNVFPPDWIT